MHPILAVLLKTRGKPVSTEHIVWETGLEYDSVHAIIWRIRKKLKGSGWFIPSAITYGGYLLVHESEKIEKPLPPQQKRALRLLQMGSKNEHIAEVMRITPNHAKTLVYRLRQKGLTPKLVPIADNFMESDRQLPCDNYLTDVIKKNGRTSFRRVK